MLYVYRRVISEGADTLVEDICLQGVRARRTQGRLLRENLQAGDHVICWGDSLPQQMRVGVAQIQALNNVPAINKLTEAQRLAAAGVPTITVSVRRPVAQPRAPFAEGAINVGAGNYTPAQVRAQIERLQRFIAEEQERRRVYEAQPVVQEEWLPRRNNHIGGSDLLNIPAAPDYFSKKENLVEEYRLHMFKGKSIRAGIKRARPTRPDGRTPAHQWIRSFDAGWIIAYENFRSNREMRELGAKALEALNLDFGAVDMGKRADGSLIVLEVNRAPGVEGGTAEAYARHIIAWAAGREVAE